MDTVPNVENSTNAHGTKGKIVLVSIVSAVAGALIGAGALLFYFQYAVFLNVPSTTNIDTLSYPNPNDQKMPDLSQEINILLPQKLVGQEYHLLINKIANELRQVGVSNISTLIPLMDAIKQKSIARDFNGFFDLIAQAKNEIRKGTDMLATTRGDIAALRKVNDESTKDEDIRKQTNVLLASSDAFVQVFSVYYSILNETLSGSVPTQDIFDKLTRQITSLRNAGSSIQSESNALLTLIQQKNTATTP